MNVVTVSYFSAYRCHKERNLNLRISKYLEGEERKRKERKEGRKKEKERKKQRRKKG